MTVQSETKHSTELERRHVQPHANRVLTTTTSTGRLIDWIPVESQVSDGEPVATPPPRAPERHHKSSLRPGPATHVPHPVSFELQEPGAQHGPAGTVPVLRGLVAHCKRVERRGADKKGFDLRQRASARSRSAAGGPGDPNPFGYYHASSFQAGTFYGCQANIAVYTPVIDSSKPNDHSIMQFGLQNYDLPKPNQPQSLEAGWTVDVGLNGDATPHLFTYYTINGYQRDGDGTGGYNELQKGWVQVDRNVHPGAKINGTSVIGGQQVELSIRYQLFHMNWWLEVQGIWLGYYPATLFDPTGAPPRALSDHATVAGFWGEVDSTLADPAKTNDQMGSGQFGETGWQHACYQKNLKVQTDVGVPSDFNGSSSAEDSSYYDIAQTMQSGTDWGSYFFAGGRGAPPAKT